MGNLTSGMGLPPKIKDNVGTCTDHKPKSVYEDSKGSCSACTPLQSKRQDMQTKLPAGGQSLQFLDLCRLQGDPRSPTTEVERTPILVSRSGMLSPSCLTAAVTGSHSETSSACVTTRRQATVSSDHRDWALPAATESCSPMLLRTSHAMLPEPASWSMCTLALGHDKAEQERDGSDMEKQLGKDEEQAYEKPPNKEQHEVFSIQTAMKISRHVKPGDAGEILVFRDEDFPMQNQAPRRRKTSPRKKFRASPYVASKEEQQAAAGYNTPSPMMIAAQVAGSLIPTWSGTPRKGQRIHSVKSRSSEPRSPHLTANSGGVKMPRSKPRRLPTPQTPKLHYGALCQRVDTPKPLSARTNAADSGSARQSTPNTNKAIHLSQQHINNSRPIYQKSKPQRSTTVARQFTQGESLEKNLYITIPHEDSENMEQNWDANSTVMI